MTPVSFTNRYGALLQGDVFAPLPGAHDPYTGKALTGPFPGVVITTGSVQGSERMYWWLAQDLAERGYVVLTYDVQGQGRSETFPHQGDRSTRPAVLRPRRGTARRRAVPRAPGSVPADGELRLRHRGRDRLLPLHAVRALRQPGAPAAHVDGYNPLWQQFDRSPDPRTGPRAGRRGWPWSATRSAPWRSPTCRASTTAWRRSSHSTSSPPGRGGAAPFDAQGPLTPVVPGLGVQSEYGFTVAPYFANPGLFDQSGVGSPTQAPDPHREEKTGFDGWKAAGVDSMVIVPRASTHLEYTDIAYVLPASRYGQDVASHYTQAWLGKYLQHDPAADDALLATSFDYLEPDSTGTWRTVALDRAEHLSFYFCSGYDIGTASGRQTNDDIAGVGCA